MTDHKIHDSLPSGFSYANELQEEEYEASGSVHGARRVIFVQTSPEVEFPSLRLAVRLRPPRALHDIRSPLGRKAVKPPTWAMVTRAKQDAARDEYIRQYNNGWQHGRRGGSWANGPGEDSFAAWEDGFLDAKFERPKWHLTYCSNHDECGEA